jgi:hypothetical protein
MQLVRYKTWLTIVIALALGAGSAFADSVVDGHAVSPNDATPPLGPFGPSNDRYDLDLFAPPDLSTYANWPRPHEGFFFQYDRLYWAISGPRRTPIGETGTGLGFMTDTGNNNFIPVATPPFDAQNPRFILQLYNSTIDTGFIQADQTWGNRYELGWMEQEKGWFVSIMNLQNQTQGFAVGTGNPTTGSGVNTNPAGVVVRFRDPQHLLYGFVDTNNDGFDDDTNIGIPGVPSSTTYRVPQVYGRPKAIPGPTLVNQDVSTPPTGVPTQNAGFTDFGDEVPLVPIFSSFSAVNVTSMVGTEITRDWRYPTTSYGVWDMMFGVRWLLLKDQLDVLAISNQGTDANLPTNPAATNPQAMPGTSYWNNIVDNNMVGPQIGLRYSHDVARFNILAEARFMAAVNFQSTHLDGELASGLDSGPTSQPASLNRLNEPLLLERTNFRSWKYDETFAPVGELRVGVNYQLTKAIGIEAEYNALGGGGISRAARRIDYVVPALQINNSNKNDGFFTDGISIGITCNR